jgi:hypothetical protein
LNHRNSFIWLDAGDAPTGVAANRSPFLLPRLPKAGGSKARKDGIAERRKAVEARKA